MPSQKCYFQCAQYFRMNGLQPKIAPGVISLAAARIRHHDDQTKDLRNWFSIKFINTPEQTEGSVASNRQMPIGLHFRPAGPISANLDHLAFSLFSHADNVKAISFWS